MADLPVLVASLPQLFIGGVLECEHGVVGTAHGQQDLIQLALGRSLVPGLGALLGSFTG